MTTDTSAGALEITQVYDLLYRLGITANYTGFFHTSYAVYLAAQQRERLLLVTKWLYPKVARHYKTTWQSVERNIRTVSELAWLRNRSLLEMFAQHPLPNRPTASVFLAILATCITSDSAA